MALPEAIISGVTVLLTLVAMGANSFWLALPTYVLSALAMIQIRRYLRRAPSGYLTESGTYSQINTTLTETVEGARTSSTSRPIPPARSTSRSSMLSAPATIPATSAGTFRSALAPGDPGTLRCAPANSARPTS